jgi:hypothetical protein
MVSPLSFRYVPKIYNVTYIEIHVCVVLGSGGRG